MPELLWQLLELAKKPTTIESEVKTNTADIPAVYREVLDFLIETPTPQDIVSFKVSQQAQTRLQNLLDKKKPRIDTHSNGNSRIRCLRAAKTSDDFT